MALNIKSAEAERDVRALAERTGESLTEAVHQAVREKLDRLRQDESEAKQARWAEAMKIIRRIQSAPVIDPRSPDEIIGYNEFGTFD